MLAATTKRITAPKRLLYGPGPSMVDPRAYEAMAQPVIGLRDPYFIEIMNEVRNALRHAFGTTNPMTFTLPAGGSGAMEAAVANFVLPGSKLAVFVAGLFAERICIMAERQRANVIRLEKPWGEVFTAAEAEAFLASERPDVVAFVQAETSTGAYQSGRAIVPAARQLNALVIADCVTSLGAMPVEVLSDDERYRFALDNMVRLFGRQVYDEYTGVGATQSWTRNRYARGEAAIFTPGQLHDYHAATRTVEGRVHFAGEHTSLKPSWVEGALESGVRTALEVT
jgi:hypothetical protein